MPQLARITFQSPSFRYFKCPYQAKVMKILEIVSNTIVRIRICRSSWIGAELTPRRFTESCRSLISCDAHKEGGCFSLSMKFLPSKREGRGRSGDYPPARK